MLERAGDMQGCEAGEDQPPICARRPQARNDGVGRGDVRDDEQAEESGRDRQWRRRDEEPARQDRRKADRVEQGLRRRGEQALPSRAAFRGRFDAKRAARCAAVNASARKPSDLWS